MRTPVEEEHTLTQHEPSDDLVTTSSGMTSETPISAGSEYAPLGLRAPGPGDWGGVLGNSRSMKLWDPN